MSDEAKTKPEPDAQQLNFEELRRDFERTKQLSEEYLNGWKRAKADYLNLRREVDKEKGELIAMANAGLLAELLPIYDHFKLAVAHLPADQRGADWVKGFDQIRRQFQELFKKLGLEEVKTIGEPFNPQQHEAVAKEKVEGKDANTVIEELSPGYVLAGHVLKPAKVKVAE